MLGLLAATAYIVQWTGHGVLTEVQGLRRKSSSACNENLATHLAILSCDGRYLNKVCHSKVILRKGELQHAGQFHPFALPELRPSQACYTASARLSVHTGNAGRKLDHVCPT